jgi:hypothetical protein
VTDPERASGAGPSFARSLVARTEVAAVAAALFGLTVLLQVWGGAFASEFGAHPDESAHYVTGVMVREYVAATFPLPPIKFAQEYYAHYPKVAIGHWPPVFYVLQAAWTLLFSPSRVSVLLLMAALASGLAVTLYLSLRDELGRLLATAATLMLVALPLTQKASGMVMAEIPLALLCFWAVLFLGRFLDRQRAGDAVLFGLAAAGAIMTKGNGLALILVAPLALVLSRRLGLLARPAFWYPAALVALICGPWYAMTAGIVHETFEGGRTPTADYALAAAHLYSRQLFAAGGLGLLPFLLVGLGQCLRRPAPDRPVPGKWAAAGALLAATWAFHCLVPSSREPRHMVMALPALMMFVAAGMAVTARWVSRGGSHPGWWRMAVVAAAVTVFVGQGFAVPVKSWSGFSHAVELLLRSPSEAPSVMLIVSDTLGEGMFISEVAGREPRPRRRVLRGSKVLAQSGWNGKDYRLLYRTPAEVLAFLDTGVEAVVLDTSGVTAGELHQQLMRETVRSHPERFESLGYFPVTRAGHTIEGAIEVWRLRPAFPSAHPAANIR